MNRFTEMHSVISVFVCVLFLFVLSEWTHCASVVSRDLPPWISSAELESSLPPHELSPGTYRNRSLMGLISENSNDSYYNMSQALVPGKSQSETYKNGTKSQNNVSAEDSAEWDRRRRHLLTKLGTFTINLTVLSGTEGSFYSNYSNPSDNVDRPYDISEFDGHEIIHLGSVPSEEEIRNYSSENAIHFYSDLDVADGSPPGNEELRSARNAPFGDKEHPRALYLRVSVEPETRRNKQTRRSDHYIPTSPEFLLWLAKKLDNRTLSAAAQIPKDDSLANGRSGRRGKSLALFKTHHGNDDKITFHETYPEKVVKFLKSLVEDAPWEQLFMRMVRMVVDEFVDKILQHLFTKDKDKGRSFDYEEPLPFLSQVVPYAVFPLARMARTDRRVRNEAADETFKDLVYKAMASFVGERDRFPAYPKNYLPYYPRDTSPHFFTSDALDSDEEEAYDVNNDETGPADVITKGFNSLSDNSDVHSRSGRDSNEMRALKAAIFHSLSKFWRRNYQFPVQHTDVEKPSQRVRNQTELEHIRNKRQVTQKQFGDRGEKTAEDRLHDEDSPSELEMSQPADHKSSSKKYSFSDISRFLVDSRLTNGIPRPLRNTENDRDLLRNDSNRNRTRTKTSIVRSLARIIYHVLKKVSHESPDLDLQHEKKSSVETTVSEADDLRENTLLQTSFDVANDLGDIISKKGSQRALSRLRRSLQVVQHLMDKIPDFSEEYPANASLEDDVRPEGKEAELHDDSKTPSVTNEKRLWYDDIPNKPPNQWRRNHCSLRSACNAGRLLSRLPSVQDITEQLRSPGHEPHWEAMLWGMQKKKCSKILCRRYRVRKGSRYYWRPLRREHMHVLDQDDDNQD